MKCGKSSKTKKSRSASGSLGTVPGCRAASSATIRGEADPTWCTCSSALGRPAMKSITPLILSAEASRRRGLLSQPTQCEQQRLGQHRAEHHIAHRGGGRVRGHGRQLERRDLLHVVAIELEGAVG